MKTLKLVSAISVLSLFGVLPLVGFAQLNTGITELPDVDITGVGGLIKILIDIISIAFTILLILAVIFVLIAAFKYLTAGGDPEKLKSAHNTLIWALVGVVVAILAIAIVRVVKNIALNI